MARRHYHWLEKVQVQATAVAACVAGYFVVWPLVRPVDPQAPVAFLAGGTPMDAVLLAVAMLVLAALCCVPTVTARPAGTVAAMLLGLGGLSIHSGPMRVLLWARQPAMRSLFLRMALELVALTAMAVAAVLLVSLVRGVLTRLAGPLAYRDLLEELSESEQRDILAEATGEQFSPTSLTGGGFYRLIQERLGALEARRTGRRVPGGDILGRMGLCLLTALAAAVALVLLLGRSDERGQLLFAALGGCFLATLIAYHLFPTRSPLPAWIAPVLTGLGLYVLASVGSIQTGFNAWTHVESVYRVLPIDWLTAGCGGGLLGYWVAQRGHESKFLEQYSETDPEQEQGA